jgi:hypothetical protein
MARIPSTENRKALTALQGTGKRVFSHTDLVSLARSISDPSIDVKTLETDVLTRAELRLSGGGSVVRYLLGTPTPWEIALSLANGAYLSHRTAARIHDLPPDDDNIIVVNHEQSQKPAGTRQISQEALTRAFARPQRVSTYVLRYKEIEIIRTNGKHTDRLGVVRVPGPDGILLDVTDLERTIIDIVVRPVYAGGVSRVRDIFNGSTSRLSIPKLLRYLRSMDFIYPYHQAIGFYLEHTGYPTKAYQPFLRMPRAFKFYLAHSMTRPLFSERWQVFYPRDFES